MREMVKTDIPWMPEISSDFSVGYVKQYFFVSKDLSNDGEPERVLKLARAGIVEKDVTTNEGQMAASYAGYNKVCVGDLLLNPMDLYSGANCNVSELNGVISPAYSNLRAKKTGTVVPKYYDYYFKSQYWLMAMFAHGKGVSFDNRWTLNNDALRSYEIPVAPYAMQQKIVDAIQDGEKKVDSLIANVQEQIEKLKTYKQSLITEVVTKGLDPNAPMKDSGVEWMGKINAEYDVRTIRSLFTIRKDIIGHEPDRVLSITQKGLRVKNIAENEGQMADSYAKYQIVRVGDFAMNHMDLLTGGIGIADVEGVTSPDYRVFAKKDPTYCSRYFLYVFESYYRNKIFYAFGQGAANMGRWRLPAQNFNKMLIPVPKVDDQYVLASHLDAKCAQIEQLISLKESKIEKLQQYKRSLIYEYVTGKKEVV